MTKNGDQTNAGGDQSYRIAITPTWEAIAKISIEALVNGTEEGQRLARQEVIDLGIKLDDAKEIIEGTDTETYKKQLNRINNQVRHIEQLETKIDRMTENYNKEAEDDLKYIRKLEAKINGLKDDSLKAQDYIADLKNQIATKHGELVTLRDHIINLEEYKAEQVKYTDERNVQKPGLPGIKHEDPIHDKILDLILDSEIGKRNKLTEDALDLVGVRELMVYTINQQIKYNETHGEDTSIDEQVANNQPHREGDE